ncbi:universal stress protein [Natronosalvus rutilus]|uniref:Universal stress protein n=1 Tax=Natronosalvus rutilus TaxID=2953753 RepID=A0A9E7N6B4_9EURY|nr:universal stress protein [Natronosalvus rutilus]UTF52532.1 universal stress protein [Natronosalvus rutilus]
MISRVLVPVDDSEMAEHALEHALEVYPNAEVTVLHVVGEPSPMWGEAAGLALADDLEAAAEACAEPVLERAAVIAADHGREITTTVQLGHPARAIVNQAEDYDVVVLGSHGGSLVDRVIVGNVAETVFRRSPVPVTVVR